ncbi:hypothetical protein ACKWTF_003970 [Chironomus riparius]
MDEGTLSKTLCEDNTDSGDSQPLILEECRACDEAKYELTFEGLWSRNTHPKDFPSNGWLTKFSDVIGASHTTEYRFWTYGEPASEGLKEVAEHGSTRQLERELKEESEHIRTIIKARGISYPNVTGKTFAVFRVDASHHLVSLVSMIYPSPDWFVGVSGLELCLGNGSWIEQKILNLYPVDAGTDSGPTYISPDQPTIPKEPIRRIKPNYPNDPRSPFYDQENKEMKPLARLYLSRQRLYEKNCDSITSQDSLNDCAIGKWTEWSKCDNPCGKGRRSRQRYYLNPQLAYQKNCKKKLTDHEECYGTKSNCDDDFIDEDYSEQNPSPECVLTDWTSFSECSAVCGKGHRSRTRRYKIRKNHKKCQKMYPVELEQFIDCKGKSCSGDEISVEQKPQVRKLDYRCRLTEWSKWSPCSSTCGLGERMRVRVPIDKNSSANDHVHKIMKLFKKFNSKNNKYRNEIENGNRDVEENDAGNSNERDGEELSDLEILGVSSSSKHPCINEEFVQKQACGMRNKPCEYEFYGMPPFCLLDPKPGACRSHAENRWYYDKNLQDCSAFPYSGCHGNKNNFESKEQCQQICSPRKNVGNKLQSYSQTLVKSSSSLNAGQNALNEKIDCEVSHWKREDCNATCGDGYRWKSRIILKHPRNGGRPCPKRMLRLESCQVNCDMHKTESTSMEGSNNNPNSCTYSKWSAWSPCSKTCGDSAVQIRTRAVLNHPQPHLCTERLEERRCEVMPCLVENFNYN